MTDITFTDVSRYLKPKQIINNDQAVKDLSAFVIYAKLYNVDELSQAHSREKHIVSSVALKTDKQIYMQLRSINDEVFMLETIYLPDNTQIYKLLEVNITKAAYEQMLLTCDCTREFVVCRYRIADTDMEWRIEEYLSRSGLPHPWVKIILELDNTNVVIPKIPVTVTEYIYAQDENLSKAQKDKIRLLETSEWFKNDASNEYVVY